MKLTVPHAGPGTHTLVVAIEVFDDHLADDDLLADIVDQVKTLVRPVLAERRGGALAERFLAEHGLTLDDVRASDRTRHVSRARQGLALLLRRHGWSLTRIGDLLCRDHTTVLAMTRAAEAREAGSDAACEGCGDEAMAGGRWCLRCFQDHASPNSRGRRTGCGTDAGYTAHRRAGTERCGPCRAAHARANRVGKGAA